MPIAVFGNKVFEVTATRINTFDDFQYSSTLETEKQESIGKKPSTYNKGPGLNTIGIKIKLDAANGMNPRKEIEDWEKIKDAGIAYAFVLGGRPLGSNKYLLIDIQVTGAIIDNTGKTLSADLSLKFDEYVRAGSAKASNGNTPGIDVDIGNPPGLSPDEKANLKRGMGDLKVAEINLRKSSFTSGGGTTGFNSGGGAR